MADASILLTITIPGTPEIWTNPTGGDADTNRVFAIRAGAISQIGRASFPSSSLHTSWPRQPIWFVRKCLSDFPSCGRHPLEASSQSSFELALTFARLLHPRFACLLWPTIKTGVQMKPSSLLSPSAVRALPALRPHSTLFIRSNSFITATSSLRANKALLRSHRSDGLAKVCMKSPPRSLSSEHALRLSIPSCHPIDSLSFRTVVSQERHACSPSLLWQKGSPLPCLFSLCCPAGSFRAL